ncbi:MAG: sel1 repeat family protein [Chitinophagales bacterium]|nr:sel1 repeat family protein [Chitinophagales bacterium]
MLLKTILSEMVLTIILFLGILCPNSSVNAQNNSELFKKGAEAIKDGNKDAGLQMIRQAALNNDNEASTALGGLYYAGTFVEQDIDSAIFWLEKAASLGKVDAAGFLGNIYLNDVSPKNVSKAKEWFEKAAQQNNVDALYNLGIIYSNDQGDGSPLDFAKAIMYFSKAAELGDLESYEAIGSIYGTGGGNVKQDYQEAFSWYLKGAEKGNETCMGRVGVMYHKGEGVQKNIAKAKEWLQKAADAGNDDAEFYLGREVNK